MLGVRGGNTFISFKVPKATSKESNSTSFKSPNTQLLGAGKTRALHYQRGDASFSRKMVYKSEGDKCITPVPNRVKNHKKSWFLDKIQPRRHSLHFVAKASSLLALICSTKGDKRITPMPNRVKNHNNVLIFRRNKTKSALTSLCRKSKRSSCSTMRRQRPARCRGRRRPDMQFRQSGRINVVEDRRS